MRQLHFGFCIDGRSVPIEDTPAYKLGREGEVRTARILETMCDALLEYCQTGRSGAPLAVSRFGDLVLPDIGIWKDGRHSALDVKTKSNPTFTGITKCYEHGFGIQSWRNYRNFQRRTGTRTLIGFYEFSSRALFVNSLDELKPIRRVYDGDAMDFGGMYFWKRRDLRLVYPTNLTLANAVRGRFIDEDDPARHHQSNARQ